MTATPHSVSQPLNLRAMIQTAPKPGFDFVAAIDLILIALFFALNGSQFIFAPGAQVDLAQTGHPELGRAMPGVVLTVGRNDVYFFENQKIDPSELEARLRRYTREYGEGGALLLKLDQSLALESLFHLMDVAREAGFSQVQLAAEEISDTPVHFVTP